MNPDKVLTGTELNLELTKLVDKEHSTHYQQLEQSEKFIRYVYYKPDLSKVGVCVTID